jgi:hypothetical protein
VCFRWPPAHIHAYLRHDGLRDHHIDPIDAREVDPADPVQLPTQIELRRIRNSRLAGTGQIGTGIQTPRLATEQLWRNHGA